MAKGVPVTGMGRAVPPKLAHYVLEKLLRGGKIVAEGELLRLPEHKVSLADDQQALRKALLEAHKASPLVPPNHTDLFAELGITPKQAQPIFKILCTEGELVKIKEDLYFLSEVMEELREQGVVNKGMIPKIDNAFRAVEAGVQRVTIKHSDNLLSNKGTIIKL